MLPIELTNADIRNSDAYKEYYAVATGATPPKPKDSVQKTSSSDTTVTPSTAAAGPRLSTFAKGKQPATTSKAKSLSALSEVAMTEAQQLKLATKRSLQQTYISQASGSGTDEGTSTIPGVLDVPTDGNDEDDQEECSDDEQASDEEEFIHPSLSTHAAEETRDEESFDPIPKTPENTDDEGNGEENLRINVGREEGHDEEEEEDELYRDVNINLGRGIQTTQEFKDSHVTLTLVKEQLKVQVSKILPKIEQTVNEQLKAKVLTQSSNSSKTSYAVAADLSKMELKKILIEKIEGNKSIHRSNEQRNLYKALVKAYESDKIILDTYGETVTLKRRRDDDADKDEEPSAGSDWGSKRRREGKEPESASAPKEKATRSAGKSTQSELTKQSDSRSSFNELMDTPVDVSAFLMKQLKVDTLTLEVLVGPTYELMKGSCKSLVELEFFLEEVKATIDQLDWVNPEGQQYPYNMVKHLPLIPNSRGHHVIPFDDFINNDLEYLRGGASSRKYTTSVTKTKAADYGYIKWIEDLVPRTMWIQEPRRIIVVIKLKIVEWHNYKHLDWITVRRDDDKLYKFKEGDFKRLHIQDIDDMLMFLVQGKLTNWTVEERFAFNKKLNLTRPDTYRSDLKRNEAYIAYSNPRGFIYQNKDKQNRLIQIDELHKFSDGTLTDVRTALDDRLK
nr:hypothetical protein [Tanacetum cinerariifolium]